ncbi:MAG: nucleotidyltransferase family protein [Bacillota bacterium]|nr:nucleotidyltransferase family protein [Bacillota bacterium]
MAAVVLAAGVSVRLGRLKQLLPWAGEPLLAHVVRQALGARVDPVIVVLGHRRGEIAQVLEPLVASAPDRLRLVYNPSYLEGGQSSSVRAGVGALPGGAAGVVILLCDMPLVRTDHIDSLVARYEELRSTRGERLIIVPSCRGRRGHPVLFGRGFFGDLAEVQGDQGGRALLRAHPEAVVEVPMGEEVLLDLDTWDDYVGLLRVAGSGSRETPWGRSEGLGA